MVNGGVFHIPAGAHTRIEMLAARLFDARKAPWRMASLVGVSFLVRFALRALSIAELETHAQRVLGIPAAAVRDCAPELAYDIDTLAEFRYARDHD